VSEANRSLSGRGLVKVRGTELLAGDTREQYRQKLARITLDSMVQFVGLLDANGTVLEINHVALDAVGIKLSDVEGKPFWTTFWWQVSEEVNATLRDSIRRASQGEFVRWDTEIFGRAGGKETIIIDASLMPVQDEHGKVVFITAEGRDITEKKAQEREIARQREELAKLDELKTQFFANISHEFRTPLTLMMGPLEDAIGEAEALSPANRERLEFAHRNALRLLKLVNTLLDFSRIESGRIQASYEPADLAPLTAELASVFRSAIERAGMNLRIDCQPISENVYVDREMWEKIVLNLVSNAFKFTFEGEIEVSLRQIDSHVQMTVRDTGTGIPPDELPRLFERFHRAKGARGRSYEGSGIGLALVQELVKLHGGSVRVESEVGRGSSFIVSLPLGKAHLPADRIEPARVASPAGLRTEGYLEEAGRWLPDDGETAPLRAERTASGRRILLADDNADMRDYVRRLLAESGHDVEAVADGLHALSAAQARKPDLVLTDVMMPGLDGFGLLRELRADPALQDVPIILVSARAGEEARIEGMQAGADDYLIKPFSARELLARVESHLKMARFRRDTAEAVRLRTAQFETLLNQAPLGVYLVDADFRIREVNPVAAPVFGSVAGGVIGRDFDEIIHILWEKPYADEVAAVFRHTLATGESYIAPERSEYRADRKAMEYYEWQIDRILLGDGRFGVVCYFRDISDRKRAVENANLLASIVESSEDAIVSKNLDGIIVSWNRGAERLFGHTAAEAVGQSIAIIIPPERLDEEPKILERLKRGERIEHFETIRIRKDGVRLNISLTISPVKDASGKIVGASKVARDFTAQVRQAQALQDANAALERANADLQQFAYSASHDLQEPLRMVAIYSELLKQRFGGQLGSSGDEYIAYTIQGARRMENLLKDLRTYTQFTTMDQEPSGDLDAGAVLEKTLLNLEVAIKESGASITSDSLPRVRIHEFELDQIFQNLIGNAIRYRGNLPPSIHITAVRAGQEWQFSVQDNGIGIEPQFQQQIFGIFKRLHSAAQYPGTGMGLAICKRIIERVGGRIWAESAPGQGSKFCFTVPAAGG
jgi:PAS domain S-box-containing protein